jgi:hypothetical protein
MEQLFPMAPTNRSNSFLALDLLNASMSTSVKMNRRGGDTSTAAAAAAALLLLLMVYGWCCDAFLRSLF